MGFQSASFDPALVAVNSDAASSASVAADQASSAAAAMELVNDSSPQLGGNLDFNKLAFRLTPLTVDKTYTGIIRDFVASQAVSWGEVCYMTTLGADGMRPAEADYSDRMPAVAMALGSIAGEESGPFLLFGEVYDEDWNWSPGGWLYVSTSAGELTQTVPTGEGHLCQIIGWAMSANCIMFDPCLMMLEMSEQ